MTIVILTVRFHAGVMSRLDTDAVHLGREDLAARGVHVPPLDLSTTYPLPSVDDGGAAYERLATGGRPEASDSLVYQRLWNPNVDRFERSVAGLEGLPGAVAFATGMAALSAVLVATVAAGRPHVVGVRPLYGGTDHVLAPGLLGTRVTWATPARIAEAIRPDTGLVVVETPWSPRPATCRSWSTTPSPPRSCNDPATTARRWCCTPPRSSWAGTAT